MANMIGQRVRGNLLYLDRLAGFNRPLLAVGPDSFTYFDDFVSSPLIAVDSPLGWTVTLVEAGAGESTITFPDVVGGALLLTTDGADNDGLTMQLDGESFELTIDQLLVYFGIKFQISDATQSDFFVGLGITDTTPLGGISDGAYFQKDDGAATFKTTTEKDSTETNTAAVGTIVAATDVTLEFTYSGTSVKFYVNGVLVATHTANIPNDEALTPTIQFLAGEAVAKTMQIDWIRCLQIGR